MVGLPIRVKYPHTLDDGNVFPSAEGLLIQIENVLVGDSEFGVVSQLVGVIIPEKEVSNEIITLPIDVITIIRVFNQDEHSKNDQDTQAI